MQDIRFKDEKSEIAYYIRRMGDSDSRTVHYLAKALRRELTEKQLRALMLYYGRQTTMREVAEELGVNKSTVSRTVRRARERLRRCLKYGARELLISALNDEEEGRR